jgi:hypothetical protein
VQFGSAAATLGCGVHALGLACRFEQVCAGRPAGLGMSFWILILVASLGRNSYLVICTATYLQLLTLGSVALEDLGNI